MRTAALFLLMSLGAMGQQALPSPPQRLSAGQKLRLSVSASFSPGEVLGAGLFASIQLAGPPKTYPREWKDGGGALGRNLGDGAARDIAANTGQVLTQIVTHEDPRYRYCVSRNVWRRTASALAFTVVDRSDRGKARPALANLAGAASGAAVAGLYLPDGFRDSAHFGQRASLEMAGYAAGNLAEEFKPELLVLGRKLHLPFLPR